MEEYVTSLRITGNADQPLTVKVVETEEAFDSLETKWDDLVSKSDCTIYQTFEWQRTWWKYFGRGKRLHTLVFTQGDEVIGIAPMHLEKLRIMGVPLAFALKASGSEESDYIDILALPGERARVLRSFVEYMRTSELRYDFFEIRDVSETFRTLQLLPQYFGDAGFSVYTYRGSVCPQVGLPPAWPDFLQRLGGNLRYQLKKKTDRLKRNFPTEIELTGNDDNEVDAAVRRFAVIHGKRWESLGYINAFKNDHFLAFHIEASQKFARRGWLRMFFLKVDGEYVAVNFDFNFHRRIYFYHGNAHASEEVMRYSPGFILRCAAIERGIAEGMETYDMLRGNEAYKTNDFKCVPVGNWQIRAVPPGRSRHIRYRTFVVYEMLRKIPKRLRREGRDFRRFMKVKNPSFPMLVKFAGEKLKDVVELLRSQILTFRSRSKE